jgi:hypothetical protein
VVDIMLLQFVPKEVFKVIMATRLTAGSVIERPKPSSVLDLIPPL